ncbi:MAG: DUF3793 family protein [Oscillibacter sp.]|nr:DUF3793 family protein [Oscillibacter sp.]
MSERELVRQAAPTLAGIKTGNLFPCRYASFEELKTDIGSVNRRLREKGLRLLPLRYAAGRALLYLYRPARLQKDLAAPEAREILRDAGYGDGRQERCLGELMRRLRAEGAFPHEIGLFLGYPPEDVRGFMEHRGRESKCEGCWKVYGDAERARETFRRYRRCTAQYLVRHEAGTPLARLAVAIPTCLSRDTMIR